jgi:pimeloyl-ACP methyl ester carboxylesterase
MAKDRLLLFVHGLGGAGQATWREGLHPGFSELISADRALRDLVDVAFFQYPTSLLHLPFARVLPRIGDLAEGLRSQIEVRYPNYKRIALICHSLGGLVARKYLIEELKRGGDLRVDKLLLFAVPNNGAGLAGVARYISWRHNQLIQLCRSSELIEELNTDWSRMKMGDRVTVRYVVAGQDGVVDKHSAIGQWGNENVDTVLDADHVSVVKPHNSTDLSYLLFRRFVLGPVPVFLSVGGGRTDRQDAFVKAIKNHCLSRELDAKTLDEYGPSNRQPLKDIEYRMKQCYGVVVLAFERTRIEAGLSRPGAALQQELKNVRLPTVWNQIEATMAYTRGLPLLVLIEHGLQDEGMLESRYDWRVKRVNLEDPIVSDPDFLGMFEDWRRSVIDNRDTPSDSMALVNP